MQQKLSPNISFVKISIFLITLALILVGGFIFVQNYFKVQTVEVFNNDVRNRNYQVKGLNNMDDFNLLLDNEAELITFLKKSNPTIESINLEKQLPSKLFININFYKPFAQLKGDRGYIIVGRDGTVLLTSQNPSSNLPQITYYQLLNMSTYGVGSKLNFEDIKSSLIFLKSSLDLGMKTTKIEINGYHMIALYSDKEKIVFNQEKDINTQKYQFETIIKELRAQDKSFKSLDVRFDKPVIVFN